MPEENDRQAILDEEHLRLISLGYMISAGVAGFFALFGLFYVLIGVVTTFALAHAPHQGSGDVPPAFVGLFFVAFGAVFFLIAGGVAFARFQAGRCVKRRKSRTFCMVIAAIGCLEFPYGTALGILSFIVLGRPSVVRQFSPKPGP